MDIYIFFPKRFFTQEQLEKLKGYDLHFFSEKGTDLDKIDRFFQKNHIFLWLILPI